MSFALIPDGKGGFEAYDDAYDVVIHCRNEQEQRRAEKRLEAANRMIWHDAKTDPPEDDRDVIVYRDGIGSVMGFYDTEPNYEVRKRWFDANTCTFLDDVTHWMEQPEPPEKEPQHEEDN